MMNEQPILSYQTEEFGCVIPGVVALIAKNRLLGCDLHAYYVFEITLFNPGEVDGVLLTCPITIHGPYDDFETASIHLGRMFREFQGD
jgi:hypothetical protein